MRALQHVNINFLVLLGKTDSVNSAVKHYQLQMNGYKWLQKMEIYRDKFFTGKEADNVIDYYNNSSGNIYMYGGKIYTLAYTRVNSYAGTLNYEGYKGTNYYKRPYEIVNLGNGEAGGGKHGGIISVANGTAALGPVGATIDIGGVVDCYGNSKMYFTFGWAYGFGATAGAGYSMTNKNFRVTDYGGAASGTTISIPFLPVGVEGSGNFREGATGTPHVGERTRTGGGNIGVESGWFGVQTFTIIFTPPPADFWSRPGSRR